MIPDKQQRASDRRTTNIVHGMIALGLFMILMAIWMPLWGKI